jgi:hypothetical protein
MANNEGITMTINGINLNVGPVLAQPLGAACPVQALGVAGSSHSQRDKFTAPAPAVALSYTGRVGTFYCFASARYSETYEPARPSAYGPIGRIESSFIGGCWRHVAYNFSGEQVCTVQDDLLLFEQSSLPLLFDPVQEIRFAQGWLSTLPENEVVNLPNCVVVYGNKDRSSLGIIRLKLCL